MGWTYNAATAKSRALDWVRLRIGDTDTSKQLLPDEAIDAALADWALSLTSDPVANQVAVRRAARDCCLQIAGRKASETEIALAGVTEPRRTASDIYRSLAKTLQDEADALERGGFVAGQGPYEAIDTMDYQVDERGRQGGEFIGERL